MTRQVHASDRQLIITGAVATLAFFASMLGWIRQFGDETPNLSVNLMLTGAVLLSFAGLLAVFVATLRRP